MTCSTSHRSLQQPLIYIDTWTLCNSCCLPVPEVQCKASSLSLSHETWKSNLLFTKGHVFLKNDCFLGHTFYECCLNSRRTYLWFSLHTYVASICLHVLFHNSLQFNLLFFRLILLSLSYEHLLRWQLLSCYKLEVKEDQTLCSKEDIYSNIALCKDFIFRLKHSPWDWVRIFPCAWFAELFLCAGLFPLYV